MDALNANRKTKQVRKPREEITALPEEVAANKVIIQSTFNSEVTRRDRKIKRS